MNPKSAKIKYQTVQKMVGNHTVNPIVIYSAMLMGSTKSNTVVNGKIPSEPKVPHRVAKSNKDTVQQTTYETRIDPTITTVETTTKPVETTRNPHETTNGIRTTTRAKHAGRGFGAH